MLNAIKAGYCHFDIAQAYANEKEVGEAIRESGLTAKSFSSLVKSGYPTIAATRLMPRF